MSTPTQSSPDPPSAGDDPQATRETGFVGTSTGAESPLPGQPDIGNSVLLSSQGMGSDDAACDALLTATAPEQTTIVLVTLTGSMKARIETVLEHLPAEPASLHAVGVGADDGDWSRPDWVTVDTIADPGDLQSLGLLLSQRLSEFDDDLDIQLCFDSITALLQYSELRRTYRFLHTLIARLETIDARGHYHLDRSAISESDVSTLQPLFDTVIDVFENGTWVTDDMRSPRAIRRFRSDDPAAHRSAEGPVERQTGEDDTAASPGDLSTLERGMARARALSRAVEHRSNGEEVTDDDPAPSDASNAGRRRALRKLRRAGVDRTNSTQQHPPSSGPTDDSGSQAASSRTTDGSGEDASTTATDSPASPGDATAEEGAPDDPFTVSIDPAVFMLAVRRARDADVAPSAFVADAVEDFVQSILAGEPATTEPVSRPDGSAVDHPAMATLIEEFLRSEPVEADVTLERTEVAVVVPELGDRAGDLGRIADNDRFGFTTPDDVVQAALEVATGVTTAEPDDHLL